MATKKTPEYDFDAWDAASEKDAIAALVPEVRHIIVGDKFVGRFADMVTVELPLKLTLDMVDELQETSDAPIDQLKHLLVKIGGEEAAAEFTSHDIAETTALASKFFEILNKVAKASLPE